MRQRDGGLARRETKEKMLLRSFYIFRLLVAEGRCDTGRARRGASRPTPDSIQEPSMPGVSG